MTMISEMFSASVLVAPSFAIRASALDPYSHLKSVMRQYRAAQLREARGLEAAPADLIDPESPPPR